MTTNTVQVKVPAHALERAEAPGHMLTTAAARALAVLRIGTGFVFLWAFLDKAFGLGFSPRVSGPGSTAARRPRGSRPTSARLPYVEKNRWMI